MVKLNEPVFVTLEQLAAMSQNVIDLDDDAQVARSKAALCSAEAEVAAYIGADDLEERSVVITRRISRFKNVLEMDVGPITTINEVQVNGDPLDPGILEIENHWWILRTDGELFPQGTPITVDYLAGYRVNSDGTNTMPKNLGQAILRLAVSRFANPLTDLTEERIGDYAYVKGREGDISVAIPTDVASLLRRLRRVVV